MVSKMKTKTKKARRRNINKEALIEQITERLHSSSNQELFDIAHITHKEANLSPEKHRLISRL